MALRTKPTLLPKRGLRPHPVTRGRVNPYGKVPKSPYGKVRFVGGLVYVAVRLWSGLVGQVSWSLKSLGFQNLRLSSSRLTVDLDLSQFLSSVFFELHLVRFLSRIKPSLSVVCRFSLVVFAFMSCYHVVSLAVR